jgi:polyhydroxybutyrate depolymerase
MALEKYQPKRPISVLHIHGTKDLLVPFNGPEKDSKKLLKFLSVNDTILKCVKANGCDDKPAATEIEPKADKLKVTRKTYGKGKAGSEVVLYVVEGGGHTWPGSELNLPILGASTNNINANELMWEFFRKHAMK